MAFDWKKLIGVYGPDKTGGSTGLGPDFPESAGDRERAKFRESAFPRLTTVAVSSDTGEDVGAANLSTEEETLLELKAIRLGIELMLAEFSAQGDAVDLRSLAAS